MTTAIQRAVTAALHAAHRVAEVDAKYLRGGQAVPITPIKSTADLEQLDAEGGAVVAGMTIFRVPAAQIVFGGKQTPPREGDRIEYHTPTQVEIYEVQPLTGDACYDPCDPDGTEYKITTRLVETR